MGRNEQRWIRKVNVHIKDPVRGRKRRARARARVYWRWLRGGLEGRRRGSPGLPSSGATARPRARKPRPANSTMRELTMVLISSRLWERARTTCVPATPLVDSSAQAHSVLREEGPETNPPKLSVSCNKRAACPVLLSAVLTHSKSSLTLLHKEGTFTLED